MKRYKLTAERLSLRKTSVLDNLANVTGGAGKGTVSCNTCGFGSGHYTGKEPTHDLNCCLL